MASIPLGNNSVESAIPRSSSLMSPHEAPASDETKAVKGEPDIVTIIKRLYEQAKTARKSRESKWSMLWDFYNGKQWPSKRPSNRASPNVNVLRTVVQTILPIMTDTSPSFGVIAREYNDFKFAELISDTLANWWNVRAMNHVMVECLMDALVTDVGIMKVVYNEDIDDGIGDVEVTVCDPRRVFVPKNAVDFSRECPWVIHEFFKSRGRLSVKFPKSADVIKRAAASTEMPNATDDDMRVRVVSPTNKDIAAPDNKEASSSLLPGNDDLRVWEAWIDDDSVIEEERINEDSGESEVTIKRKYPHGRFITLLPDANEVLQDVENPYRDGEKPFVRFIDTLEPRSFYGVGDVEPLLETQRMINKVFATILDWSNMMSNPCWIVDTNSGVDPDMITSQVGQIIVKNAGSTVQRQDAPPIPPQMFELYHTQMQLLDQQSGIHDVTQGRKPAGITAAQAIETLQEAAQTRIRLKERNQMVSLHRLGKLVIARMLQYYTEPRVLELTGRDDLKGSWPTYVKFYVEQIDEDGDQKYRPVMQRVEYDEATGQYVERPAEEGNVSRGQFELDITTGTSLPYIKQQRSEQAIRLWEDKGIDQKALLDVIDFPEKDAILQRMEEAQKQQQQQAPTQQPPQVAA